MNVVTSMPASAAITTTGMAINPDLSITMQDPMSMFIEHGSPDSYLGQEIINLVNDSLFNTTDYSIIINSGNGTGYLNDTRGNSTGFDAANDVGELIVMAATSLILGLMILITIIGNVFVIAAIILERNLQNVANYLVASLAVADLFVACLVMPLGAVYEISEGWILGPELCDIWTSCDVLCCTASILHLVAIATDRYWAVTNVDYIHSRTKRRVFIMIILVWFAAVIVSLAPQFGWKDPHYLERIEKQQKCLVSQDVFYQVFATCCTFYVPLLVILALYWKIYQTARKRIHRRRQPMMVSGNNNKVETTPSDGKTRRLHFNIASKFKKRGKATNSSLGLVDGHSTVTVNTMEDTEYNTSNAVGGCKKTNETTTFMQITDEMPTSSSSGQYNISTVSENVQKATISTSDNVTYQDTVEPPPYLQTDIDEAIRKDELAAKELAAAQAANGSHTMDSLKLDEQEHPESIVTPHHAQQNQTIDIKYSEIHSQVSTPTIQPELHNRQQQKGIVSSVSNPQKMVTKRKETLEAKRERKAAKTLAIITGAFVICWLPFFFMALLLPLCGEQCEINDTIESLFLWLGYFNSTLNPVIYTIFSPEFRQAFKRILFGTHRTGYYRGGKL